MTSRPLKGFSMLEAMVTVLVGAMILVALFMIFGNARRAASSITQKLDSTALPGEIFQRIMEDLDRVAGPGSGAKIEIHNNYSNGFPGAQLKITSTIIDRQNKPQVLEEIIWQTSYDLASKRLILWRCHAGLVWEDKLLDEQERALWTSNRRLFVPVCTGLSYFRIQIPQAQQVDANQLSNTGTGSGSARDRLQRIQQQRLEQQQLLKEQQQLNPDSQYLYSWEQQSLPPAVMVVLSFADPIEGRGAGGVEVLDNLKISRTISVDRLKKYSFSYTPIFDANDANTVDPNSAQDKSRDTNDPNSSKQTTPRRSSR